MQRRSISRAADRRITLAGLLLSAGFLAAALVAAILPKSVRRGLWLPVHLALAGAGGTAIASVLPFFVAALSVAPPMSGIVRGGSDRAGGRRGRCREPWRGGRHGARRPGGGTSHIWPVSPAWPSRRSGRCAPAADRAGGWSWPPTARLSRRSASGSVSSSPCWPAFRPSSRRGPSSSLLTPGSTSSDSFRWSSRPRWSISRPRSRAPGSRRAGAPWWPWPGWPWGRH